MGPCHPGLIHDQDIVDTAKPNLAGEAMTPENAPRRRALHKVPAKRQRYYKNPKRLVVDGVDARGPRQRSHCHWIAGDGPARQRENFIMVWIRKGKCPTMNVLGEVGGFRRNTGEGPWRRQ